MRLSSRGALKLVAVTESSFETVGNDCGDGGGGGGGGGGVIIVEYLMVWASALHGPGLGPRAAGRARPG